MYPYPSHVLTMVGRPAWILLHMVPLHRMKDWYGSCATGQAVSHALVDASVTAQEDVFLFFKNSHLSMFSFGQGENIEHLFLPPARSYPTHAPSPIQITQPLTRLPRGGSSDTSNSLVPLFSNIFSHPGSPSDNLIPVRS